MARDPLLLYKNLTYSQLRSFCETARLGSMAAAARSLRLSHPTIWKQIRALEKQLGQELLETHERRTELTEAGRTLARLAAAVVAEFETLQDRFQQACGAAPKRLAIGAPSRACTDDLVAVIEEFRSRHPEIHLAVREVFEHQGDQLLESGEVEIVIGDRRYCQRLQDLVVEALYEIEPMVIMPDGHPLARRRKIRLADLSKYPVLNRSNSYPDDEASAVLSNARVFDHPDRCFDLVLASSIRHCVRLGFGIGLVGRVGKHPPYPGICERSLKHCLPPITCYAYRMRRVTESARQTAFIQLAKEMLHS